MNIDANTLTQLLSEAKEKRYVTLDAGSKISGYTKDYLGRICRLNKIECRLLTTGEFAIEIDALLKETHTILLSDQDVNFVAKDDLSPLTAPEEKESTPLRELLNREKPANAGTLAFGNTPSGKMQKGMTQEISGVGQVSKMPPLRKTASPLSFIGRTERSEVAQAEATKENEATMPITLGSVPTRAQEDAPVVAESLPVTLPEKKKEPVPVTLVVQKILHDEPLPVSPRALGEIFPSHPLHQQIQTAPPSFQKDEWDEMISGVKETPVFNLEEKQPVLPIMSAETSLYHPIKTSLDATVHRDDAPLFPQVGRPVNTPSLPEASLLHPKLFGNMHVPHKKIPINSILPTPPGSSGGQVPSVASPKIPLIRVMPQISKISPVPLPMLQEEHQLAPREQYLLTKSPAFNVVVALFIFGATLFFSGGILRDASFVDHSIRYVANASSALFSKDNTFVSPPLEASSMLLEISAPLPFSDEVRTATGTEANSVFVQPIFRDSVGSVYEYLPEKNMQ